MAGNARHASSGPGRPSNATGSRTKKAFPMGFHAAHDGLAPLIGYMRRDAACSRHNDGQPPVDQAPAPLWHGAASARPKPGRRNDGPRRGLINRIRPLAMSRPGRRQVRNSLLFPPPGRHAGTGEGHMEPGTGRRPSPIRSQGRGRRSQVRILSVPPEYLLPALPRQSAY